ncbi:MAG: serine/threonine-protein kinase, partial [Planctomycetota bacterium]
MRDSDPITSAAFFDFLQDFEDDSRAGELRSLTTYLARYPEAESEIAAEYVRRTGSQSLLSEDPNDDEADEEPESARRYRLIRPLGQGGQGTVYLAEDKRLGREVALKQLDGRWITKTRRLRFQREAEIVARVEHPSIAEVLDADFESATPFLVMRYVKGFDLARLLRAESEGAASGALTLPPADPDALDSVLRYFEETARALHVAHEAGVVHRDVKPGNLMVTQDGSPCVLDFGLAIEANGESLTREGEGLGTPEYMAPEQVSSSAGSVDRKTDVHALGLVMYESLTGRRPFEGSTVHEIHRAVLDHERPRLTGSFGRHGRDLGIVVATAMERDPTRRYASALALAEDLRRVRATEPILARPAGPWLQFRRWVQREPALSTAVFVLIASLSVGLIL